MNLMNNAVIQTPVPVNEPVLNYAPGSPEKAALKAALEEMSAKQIDIPIVIGGKEIRFTVGSCVHGLCIRWHRLQTLHS